MSCLPWREGSSEGEGEGKGEGEGEGTLQRALLVCLGPGLQGCHPRCCQD